MKNEERYRNAERNIEKYGNKNGVYKPFDYAISYPLHSMDFIRTGFLEIAPTLSARDFKDPKIILRKEPMIKIRQATKKGYTELNEGGVFNCSFPNSKTRRGRVIEEGNISPTLTTSEEVTLRYEEKKEIIPSNLNYRKINKINVPVFKTLLARDYKGFNTGNDVQNGIIEKESDFEYRIRRLTPLECFRLMGVTDGDAEKMLSVNSETQCYKQAGNSIVVDVMEAMFRELF